MIKTIKGTYFRRHVDITINLTAGVNAFRAPNEAGKSTIIEMLTYAFFGAAGLKDPIDQVVTTGTPASKLSVQVECEFNGVDYHVKRGASGAELSFGKEKVTGQTAVTKFFENLFGATADLAFKLMIAEQSSLRGALTGGPAAAGKMVEELANFKLIEEIIEMIQEKLLTGPTVTLEGRLVDAKKRAEDLVEFTDTSALEDSLKSATAKLAEAEAICAAPKEDLLSVEEIKTIERNKLEITMNLRGKAETLKDMERIMEEQAKLVPLPCPTANAIEALRMAKTQANEVKSLQALKASLERIDTTMLWDDNAASLQAEVASTKLQQDNLADQISGFKVDLARLEGKLVKEQSCAFCGKDLQDVPEVVQINSKYAAEIATVKHLLAEAVAKEKELKDMAYQLSDIQNTARAIDKALAVAGKHVEINSEHVPSTYKWLTPINSVEDVSKELEDLLAQEAAAVKVQNAIAAKQQQLNAVKERYRKLEDMNCLPEQVQELEEQLAKAKLVEEIVRQEQVARTSAKTEVDMLKLQLAQAVDFNKRAEAAQVEAKKLVDTLQAELTETNTNNVLLKKIRAARPVISDKLWSMVLSAVSTYFSQVRQFPSTVTRESNTFKVNGVPIGEGGLSGSAKDALGLAIRMALVKMFLPNTSFLILDELAAACDDQREIAMLGLVSTAGFQQVILVTHSNLCESYADNIITL